MNQVSQSNLSNKTKQLRQIKEICSQGRQINNMQIRSMLTSIAYNIQILFQSEIKNKQNGTKLPQIQQITKGQFTRQDIQTELNIITDTMMKKNSLLDQKIQKISNNFLMELERQRKIASENVQKQLFELNGSMKYKFKQLQDIFLKQLKKQSKSLDKKIEQLRQLIQQKPYSKIVEKKQMAKYSQIKQDKQEILASSWVDPEFCQFKNLDFQDNKITVKAWTDIYGKRFKQLVFTFSILINKLEGKKMAIGVIDSIFKTKIKPTNQPNQIYYHSSGFLWDGTSKKNIEGYNKGYAQKQTVKVTVDMKYGSIEWRVGDQTRCGLKIQKLKDTSINWVPFIFLGQKGDSVRIVG